MQIWNLAISITNACNLSCKHCYAKAGIKENEELTLEDIYNIMDEAKKCNVRFITLTGGEPFMRTDVWEIIRIIKKSGIKVSIATNGILLTEELILRLKQLGVERVQISLDGAKEATNDYVRGEGTYRKIVDEVVPNLVNSGIFTAFSYTPTDINVLEIPEVIELAYKLGVNTMSFRRYSNTGRAKINELSIGNSKNMNMLNALYEIKKSKKYEKMNISTGDPLFVLCNPERSEYFNKNIIAGCTAGITSLAIDAIGNIKPCTRANFILGNIRSDSLHLIWETNETLQKLRNRNNLIGKCGTCESKMLCGGCRVAALEENNDIFSEDPSCWLVL